MFDFSDATRLGFDFTRSPAVGHVPACFGPVKRLALVSPDLGSTLWEVQATGPGIELHESFVVGSTPPGFRSVTPLGGPLPASAFLVANGPDAIGLGVLQPQNREQPAGDCK